MNGIERVARGLEARGVLTHVAGIDGYSGEALIGLLQRLARTLAADECYLEVGVFRGLTLLSVAAAAPGADCYGVDNFSQFDPGGDNERTVRAAISRLGLSHVHLVNRDFEDALLTLGQYIGPRRIGVYFVDGPHDYRSQYLCLDFAHAHLSDDAVIVVDDANYEHVRRATRDWLLANPGFALAFEAYTAGHPGTRTPEGAAAARAGWWNGVHVIVRDAGGDLERLHPPVAASRETYFNDHLVRGSRYPEMAAAVMRAFSRPFPRALLELARLLRRRPRAGARPFEELNTESAGFAAERRAAPTRRRASA
jgi:predicted O-methyltransferase YrrM